MWGMGLKRGFVVMGLLWERGMLVEWRKVIGVEVGKGIKGMKMMRGMMRVWWIWMKGV